MTNSIEVLLRTFTEVARLASFSQAAKSLGLSRAAVSAQVAQLETRLRASLLHRTTRQVRLTAEGERLLAQSAPLLAGLDGLTQQFHQVARSVQGPLRVEAPEFVGTRLLAAPLVAWLQSHPEVQLTLRLNDRTGSVEGSDADVLLRFELPREHRLRYRLLGRWPLLAVASPNYLRRHGEPQRLAQLDQHAVIDYLDEATGKPFDWEFLHRGRLLRRRPPSRLVCNNTDAALSAALGGLGLYRDFPFVVQPYLQSGQLRELGPALHSPPYALYALWRPTQPLAPRVEAFLRFLSETITSPR